MTFPTSKMQERILRFRSGISLTEIATLEGVETKTVYNYLLAHKVLTKSYLSDEFLKALAVAEPPLSTPVKEYAFVVHAPVEKQHYFLTATGKPRGWKTDLAWPWHHIAVEIDGGKHIGKGGAHNNDREKRNAYAVLGWRVLAFDTDMILGDVTACVEIVRAALTSDDQVPVGTRQLSL